MTYAPTVTAEEARKPATQPQSSISSEIRSFLRRRFSGTEWLCIGWVDGDPQVEKGNLKQEWFEMPRQARDTSHRLEFLASQGYNLYVSSCQHSRRKRIYASAIPGKWLWIDDVPAETDCTVLVQTSEQSHQAHFELDQAITADERSWLQKSIAAELGADVCSSDAVHLMRLPGGWNRKRHGKFAVRVVRDTHTIYSVDELRQLYPMLEGSTHRPHSSASEYDKENWVNLRDGEALWNNPIVQKAINLWRPQLKILLVDRERVIVPRKDGTPDSSLSAQRAVFVCNFLQLNNPFPLSDVRALALVAKPIIGADLSDSAYRKRIDDEIIKYHHELYTNKGKTYRPHAVRLTSSDVAVTPVPEKETKVRGRPYAAGDTRADKVAQIRAILGKTKPDAFGIVPVNTAAIAKKIGKSPRMVRNYLNDLVEQKEIKYAASGKGKKLAVLLIDTPQTANIEKEIKSLAAESTVLPIDTLETAHSEKEIKSSKMHAVEMPVLPIAALEIEVQPDSPIESTESIVYSLETRACEISSVADISLSALVIEYLDNPDLGKPIVNKSTGNLMNRHTASDCASLVAEHYGDLFTHDDVIAAYKVEKDHRKALRLAEWDRFFKRLNKMQDDELIAYIQGRCKAEIAELQRKHDGSQFDIHTYKTRLKHAKRRLKQLGIEMPAKPTRSKSQKHAQQPVGVPAIEESDLEWEVFDPILETIVGVYPTRAEAGRAQVAYDERYRYSTPQQVAYAQ